MRRIFFLCSASTWYPYTIRTYTPGTVTQMQVIDWAFNSYLFSIFSHLIMIFSFRCMVYWNTWDY